MSVPPATETQVTVPGPRPLDATAVATRTHATHPMREYWDLERCAWVPCPVRAEG